MRGKTMQRRHFNLAIGMAAAVALTAAAMISSTATGETADGPQIGMPAPQFTGVNTAGEAVSLSDFEGQTVILEWTNHGCPFVQKHYDPAYSNMQNLQADAAEDGIAWLTVISSAPGKQGHVSAAQADELTSSRGAAPAHVILDESGDIGRAYDAKTTPHMYIITPEGELAYKGAIDSVKSARVDDIPEATNHVTAALDALQAGQPVDPASTKAYGCSVKY